MDIELITKYASEYKPDKKKSTSKIFCASKPKEDKEYKKALKLFGRD